MCVLGVVPGQLQACTQGNATVLGVPSRHAHGA